MSVKQNKALSIDREQVELVTVYTEALSTELTDKRAELFPHIQYMIEDDNIKGGDMTAHKASMEATLASVTELTEKVGRLAVIMRKLSVNMGNNAAVKKVDIANARDAVVAATMKMKQTAQGK